MGARGVSGVATRGVAVDPCGVRDLSMEAAVSKRTRRKKPLLCRLNMRHRWERHSTEDGEDYRE